MFATLLHAFATWIRLGIHQMLHLKYTSNIYETTKFRGTVRTTHTTTAFYGAPLTLQAH